MEAVEKGKVKPAQESTEAEGRPREKEENQASTEIIG